MAECRLGEVDPYAARRLLRCRKLLFMGSSVVRRHMYAILHTLLAKGDGRPNERSPAEWRAPANAEVEASAKL